MREPRFSTDPPALVPTLRDTNTLAPSPTINTTAAMMPTTTLALLTAAGAAGGGGRTAGGRVGAARRYLWPQYSQVNRPEIVAGAGIRAPQFSQVTVRGFIHGTIAHSLVPVHPRSVQRQSTDSVKAARK